MGKGDGSLTAINWYLTCSRLSCHLLEVGIYKERADIEVIKSCLLKEKNSIADCYRMENHPGATNTKKCQNRCFYLQWKLYISIWWCHGSGTRWFWTEPYFLLFSFLLKIVLIIIIIATLKSNFYIESF